jgi:hypothetical protein
MACTIMNIWDGLPMAVFCIYAMFISDDWFYINLVMYVLAIVGLLGVIFVLVESPKWLLINGRREEAITNLNYIGRINGKSLTQVPMNARFVEELAFFLGPDADESTLYDIITQSIRNESSRIGRAISATSIGDNIYKRMISDGKTSNDSSVENLRLDIPKRSASRVIKISGAMEDEKEDLEFPVSPRDAGRPSTPEFKKSNGEKKVPGESQFFEFDDGNKDEEKTEKHLSEDR